jgi:hypothetical protein
MSSFHYCLAILLNLVGEQLMGLANAKVISHAFSATDMGQRTKNETMKKFSTNS